MKPKAGSWGKYKNDKSLARLIRGESLKKQIINIRNQSSGVTTDFMFC